MEIIFESKTYAFVTQKDDTKYYRNIENPKDEISVNGEIILPFKI